MKEGPRIEEDDHGDARSNDHRKIEIVPSLPGRSSIGKPIESVGDHQDRNCKHRTAEMDDVRFFREDHAGHSHPSAPKVIYRSELPETEQSQNEHH